MNSFIETARCKLTTLQTDDQEHVVKLYTNKAVQQFLGGPLPQAEALSKFPQLIQASLEAQCWAIRLQADNTFIGLIYLGTHHNGLDTEISYQLLPAWWGQGYATETVQALIDYVLDTLGVPRVMAETQVANVASCQLLERLGFQLEQIVVRFGAEQAIYVINKQRKGV